MPKVSIIMPSLDVAAYIRECMDSVVCQTLQDIEIICIDAGSADGTFEILREYAKRDPRIKLILSSRKSYGYQMNLGLREATGDYIGIVETDDFVLPEMFEELYTYAKDNDADFVKSDFDIFTTLENGKRIFLEYSLKKHSGIQYNTVFTADDFMNRKQTIDVFIWNGIYKREFLLEKNIWFQETSGAAFQDCGFRYQVVMKVKRGGYLNHSYYRYRRDNINSSTYNSKCVAFNLAECKNLINIFQKEKKVDSKRMDFLAREIAVIALAPYRELLTWGQPADGMAAVLEEFRLILKDFINRGNLRQSSVAENAWLEIRMFVENPDFYNYYTRLKAEINAESVKDFLRIIASKNEVVIFGCGYIGSCAYCLVRNNGIDNVAAFCDNDRSKWNTSHMECLAISPEEASKRFPKACFLIANAAHSREMQKQLCGYGIGEKQILTFGLQISPLDCTNVIMRSAQIVCR